MQLSVRARAVGCILLAVLVSTSAPAYAQTASATIAGSVFHEQRSPLETTVVTTTVAAEVLPIEDLAVNVGWDVDVVSAASVAVVDGPADVDVITSATRMSDTRHTVSAGVAYRGSDATLRASYAYGFESDYRAHTVGIGGSVDLFAHATTLALSYALSIDSICDARNDPLTQPAERSRLYSSIGCFGPETTTRDALANTVDLSLVQVLRTDLIVRVIVGVQRIDGFQSSPYREVWIGPWAAEENHPQGRSRGSLGLEGRLALPGLSATLTLAARGYHDDWDVSAASGELAWEQRLAPEWRMRARGRAYTQSAAAFYSDDYSTQPRGEYFTGDRELSTMSSLGGGLRLAYAPEPDTSNHVLGALSALRVVASIDASRAEYPHFHYGLARVPDGAWFLASLSIEGEL